MSAGLGGHLGIKKSQARCVIQLDQLAPQEQVERVGLDPHWRESRLDHRKCRYLDQLVAPHALYCPPLLVVVKRAWLCHFCRATGWANVWRRLTGHLRASYLPDCTTFAAQYPIVA
jgi:hypothetical protein